MARLGSRRTREGLMPVFEFEIHNQQVLDALKDGGKHKFFKDEWADTHFIEFSGADENEARSKAERRYPSAQGFVVTGINQL
jgi:hypothetical protein